MKKHNLNSEHVLRKAYNPDNESFDMTLKNTDVAIELSHNDGDSVYAHKDIKSLTLEANQVGCIFGCTEFTLYLEANTTVECSPDEINWYPLCISSEGFEVRTMALITHCLRANKPMKVMGA